MMRSRSVAVLVLSSAMALFSGCQISTSGGADVGSLRKRAEAISRETLIVDMHVDLPHRLMKLPDDVSKRTESGHFDYPRAKEGGLDAPFMSIYVPATYQKSGGARDFANRLIDLVENLESSHPDKFAVARSPDDVVEQFQKGLVSFPLGIENGAAVEGKIENLDHFYKRGVRYVTLTHSKWNAICDSSYDEERRWKGLSPFGREVVAKMNELGMMVDISHVSDDAFHQVAEISKAPLIATHSSCRHFTPGWERNMSDEMIRKLAEGGGVIAINFGSGFLSTEAQKQSTLYYDTLREFMETTGADSKSEEVEAFKTKYWEGKTRIRGNVQEVVDHIDHVVKLVGIEHVGIGSDFDGVTSLPENLD
ncbi:MAG: dipeptidase, partial [Planctomycetota bacterium]